MTSFRKETPKRRETETKVNHYREHRDSLKEDFNNRCGYCDALDTFKRAYYEIDHFIPKKILEKFFTIPAEYKDKEQEYSNLIYACQSCNNAKRNKWPTGSIEHSFIGDIGFIDPCKSEYDDQFRRNEKGEIIPISKLGEWMHKELKLWKPEHSILWYLDMINQNIEKIENLMIDNEIKEDNLIQMHYSALLNFRKYYKLLTEY